MRSARSDRLTASERREAIVQAAAPLFAANGMDAVTTRDIAQAAGVSEALLYRHFESKAAIYQAIQEACTAEATVDAARIARLPDSTATLVLACYLVMSRIQLGSLPGSPQEHVPRLILQSLLTDGQFAEGFVRSTSAKWIDKIERCVRAGIASGELEVPFEQVIGSVWFAHHIACSLVYYRLPGIGRVVDYPGGSDPEHQLDLSVRFALRGLGLTKQAIERHYQPTAFALLRNAAPVD